MRNTDLVGQRLIIVYRSTDAENDKPRPSYYSKDLALASILRSAEALPCSPRFHFLNDGDLPIERLAVMQRYGRVHRLSGGSNRATFRSAVACHAAVRAGDRDIVWFAEDDYLYRPDALSTLMAGAVRFPEADYFSLYGSDALDTTAHGSDAVRRTQPGAEGNPAARNTGDAIWFPAHSTTSTFGVRGRALREDAALLRAMPWTGGAWDTATCLALQGYRPFPVRDQWPGRTDLSGRLLLRALVRMGANVWSSRRSQRRRVLLGTDPELIWHMEVHDHTTRLPPSARTRATPWALTAAETCVWAKSRSLPCA
ncbi:hypothetical protein I4I73_06480 [Pseudonocardia sp. KRD-184]|uniref:Glycosyl transferase family 2 n=1 Tax=Pseudonocardia oceani TaxID=2792013 RepID=A0ABS6U3W8_9PSEU|nr:hypothetical protein [Pseudonocardia oceani]MBW0088706.1 hypothetical protein [Pseudonocardia oceani]MBW0095645.1 hypothetical protein [Pseudonocardia oceani]MBW0121830.1 hypothetical protein [Pseudonocardia oceani]MBW0126614.1 hypothetical protein [Pseudonocardia oceani]